MSVRRTATKIKPGSNHSKMLKLCNSSCAYCLGLPPGGSHPYLYQSRYQWAV